MDVTRGVMCPPMDDLPAAVGWASLRPFVAVDRATAATVRDDEGAQRYHFRASPSAYLC